MTWRENAMLMVVAVAASACAPSGLDFRADDRLVIDSPADRSAITVPVTVTWTLRDRRGTEAGFAVLVDVIPPRPGKPLSTLLPKSQRDLEACDALCQRDALAARGVFATTATTLQIRSLPRPTNVSEEQAKRHRVIVIVLDQQGRRSGEVADFVTFDEEFE